MLLTTTSVPWQYLCVSACAHAHTHLHFSGAGVACGTHTNRIVQKVVLQHPCMLFYLLSQKPANPSVALIPLILQPEWRRLGGKKSALVPENTVRGAVGSRPLVSEQL